jgi:hypothetical protein
MSGRYESWYVRAVDPAAPRGVWIRHTTLQRPGAPPARSLWCTAWDAAAGSPVTAKATPGECAPFTPDAFRGSVAAGPHHASWDLVMAATDPPLRHLPHPLLYAAPLPRTKLESPAPAARVSGRVEAGDRRLELDGWPGMVGHNWGAQHAERWLWLHATGFEDAAEAWLDLALGRIRIGPVTTPWIANGALHVAGARRHLGGLARRPQVDARPGEATVVLDDVRIRVTAPREQTVAWVYADPPGGEHHALNCSIAGLELSTPSGTLATPHGGAYELGLRERDHGIPLAPFPDP